MRTSSARTPRDYRIDGANRIYELHPDRVYKGQLPPMLRAVGVLRVEIDTVGQVHRVEWMRPPNHAPEVMAEIERMVRAAAPFPAPIHMGPIFWTDTWLWDRSGRFQIDSVSEGQADRLAPAPRRRP